MKKYAIVLGLLLLPGLAMAVTTSWNGGALSLGHATSVAPTLIGNTQQGNIIMGGGTLTAINQLYFGVNSAQFIPNGSFEAEPAGTAVVIGSISVANSSTFSSWRVFSVGSPPVDGFSATLVTTASDGNVAMRLDKTDTGIGVGEDAGLDRNDSKVPVEYGVDYAFSFDAGWLAGSTDLLLTIAEFDLAGNFLGQQSDSFVVSSTNYQQFTLEWTPLNATVSSVNIAFRLNVGVETFSSLLLDNIRLVPKDLPVGSLYAPMPSFNRTDHVVGTSVFHWYAAAAGQLSGPWLPLEGRPAWTGQPDWWMGQVKQMMMANIDILYVHLIPWWEQQRINLFNALNLLRYEGYDVPKVVPFLDPMITWDGQPNVNLATTAGKDEFVDQYIRFFNQYYSANQDPYADDYLGRFDDQVILDTWHVKHNLINLSSLTRSDVTSRLATEFGPNSPFTNDIYMITTALNDPTLAFADEKVAQFEIHSYNNSTLFNGVKATQVKAGYWDQNVRSPGTLLPRAGGSHYSNAWNQINGDSSIDHVYIESFNEYDEGSGIYAVDATNSPWIKPGSGNPSTDTWSSTDDPYEYIRTSATGAAMFNDVPNHDAKILWHEFPDIMYAGETQVVTVVVRNTGDSSWAAAANYKFGDKADGAAQFGASLYLLDDNEDEIPVYGGIFRGRPKTFTITLIAPTTPGIYETHWGMLQEYVEWFGEDLAHTFTIEAVDPPEILDWTPAATPGVMKMVVDAPDLASRYHPEASTNLVAGGWAPVPHSDTDGGTYHTTNLGYSTADGTNEVIYVQTDDAAESFKIIGE